MDERDRKDMELDADDGTSTRSGSQTVRKNIPLKLKVSKGRGKKGRGRKGSRKAEKQHEEDEDITEEKVLDLPNLKPEPFFCAPKICWEHKVTLIGEKVVDPLIHCCEKCDLPILVYGRMIPCKHVFCLDCAKRTEKYCQRCSDPVSRIEQSALGTVFICTSGGSKHGVSGCRRTYLSQRDLQAHINYRHLGRQAEPRHGDTRAMEYLPQPSNMPIPPGLQLLPPPPPNFRVEDGSHMQSHLPPPPPQQGHLPPPPPQQGHPPLTAPPAQTHLPAPPTSSHIESYHTIPVMSTNLITVQIQEEDFQRRDQGGNYLPAPGPGPFSQSQSPTRSAPPPGVPPPLPYPPSLSSPPPVSFAPYSSGGLPPHSHPHMGPPPGQRPPLLTQPPPMVSHPGGPPPPRPVPPVSSHGPIPSSHPPSNYPSPHHHDPPPSFSQPGQPDNHGPSHWSGAAPGGPPAAQPRPPPPTRTATSSAGGMGQPPPGSYYQ